MSTRLLSWCCCVAIALALGACQFAERSMLTAPGALAESDPEPPNPEDPPPVPMMQMVLEAQAAPVIRVETTALLLEPNVRYSFTTPVLLNIRHPAPPPATHASGFVAIAAPLSRGEPVDPDEPDGPFEPGEPYTLTFVLEPTPMLTVENGIVYAAGIKPTVGGKVVGSHGTGTVMILESSDEGDYVYLLDGPGVRVFTRGDVGDERATWQTLHRVARFQEDEDGEPVAIAGDRATVRDRMVVLASLADIRLPPPPPGPAAE